MAGVNAAQFKALLKNANLENEVEAAIAQDVLSAMLLEDPTTKPPRPTRTTDGSFVGGGGGPGGENTGQTTEMAEETTTVKVDDSPKKVAKGLRQIQNVMTTMLDVENVQGLKNPDLVEMRFPLSIVAGKILSGNDEQAAKWDAFYNEYPEEEGAPKTLRELMDYMTTWVGACNTSSTQKTQFFDPDTDSMKMATSGEDFVMNSQKLPVSEFRKSPRLLFPNYEGKEWLVNRDKWNTPKDTFSIPTGMFKNQPGCNDNPVTFTGSIFNKLGRVMPHRRNMAYIRSSVWSVDSKVVSTKVAASVNSMDYDEDDLETAARCLPDKKYMKDNPVKATLWHLKPGKARLTRRLLSWFSDVERKSGGIEVRHCVWWNEDFGSSGAWDPVGCYLRETDANKTECECENFGSMAVVMEIAEDIVIIDNCYIMTIIKYVGIGFSVFTLLVLIIMTIASKFIWDMFHVIRMHTAITWICAVLFHIATDLDQVRDDPTSNIAIGFFMKYFYTSSCMWTLLEAHATFKAFTSGIISGRTKVYFPFGYGTPVLPLGVLFLVYHDDFGIDPRCFVAWNYWAKFIYLMYNNVMALGACVFAIIIIFNLSRPQTKRKNVVADLTSQARGLVVVCFLKLVLWLFATFTYLHHQESDWPDPYCPFSVFLGWFGFVMFLLLGVGSKKFRYGLMGERRVKKELNFTPIVNDADAIQECEDTASIASRPATAASIVTQSEEVDSINEMEPIDEDPDVEDEEELHDEMEEGNDEDTNEDENEEGQGENDEQEEENEEVGEEGEEEEANHSGEDNV